MDNLTHTLVGAAIGRAGAARATPLATATLVVAANAPDIDVLAFSQGPYFALAFRRGITHGWPALVVLALVVALVMLAWDRWVRRRRDSLAEPARAGPLLTLSAVGVLSHPALDWLNTYGVRWSMPLDDAWSYGDTLFIIDPWIWLALGGLLYLTGGGSRRRIIGWGVLAAATTALVLTAPVGAAVKIVWCTGLLSILAAGLVVRRNTPPSRMAGGLALLAVAVYIGAGVFANRAARGDVLAAASAAGLHVTDVMVAPRPGTPFGSEVEVETPDGFVPGTHGWWTEPRVRLLPERIVPVLSTPVGMPDDLADRVVRAAHRVPDVAHYLVWSRYPITRIEPAGDGWRVIIQDARYDERGDTGSLSGVETFVAAADLDGVADGQ
jgi:inner membrane protein